MAGLFGKLAKLASTPQGRQALDKAKRAAADPKNKEKVNDLVAKAKGAVSSPGSKTPPPDPPAPQAAPPSPPPPAAGTPPPASP